MSKKIKTIIMYALAITAILGAFMFNQIASKNDSKALDDLFNPVAEPIITDDNPLYVFVDIKGAVQSPGVYKMAASDRVYQLIERAGGSLGEADLTTINQAAILTDGSIIYIPTTGENIEEDSTTLININTASIDQLITLPNIGEATAKAMLDYRNEQLFESKESILEVSGIGDATFEAVKDLITY